MPLAPGRFVNFTTEVPKNFNLTVSRKRIMI